MFVTDTALAEQGETSKEETHKAARKVTGLSLTGKVTWFYPEVLEITAQIRVWETLQEGGRRRK